MSYWKSVTTRKPTRNLLRHHKKKTIQSYTTAKGRRFIIVILMDSQETPSTTAPQANVQKKGTRKKLPSQEHFGWENLYFHSKDKEHLKENGSVEFSIDKIK